MDVFEWCMSAPKISLRHTKDHATEFLIPSALPCAYRPSLQMLSAKQFGQVFATIKNVIYTIFETANHA